MRTITITLTDEQARKLDVLKSLVWEAALVKLTDEAYIPMLIEGHYQANAEVSAREEEDDANSQSH